ncbi:MAG: pectate lyase [Armatimonadota bacterium]|jgi:pectate lyase
MIYRPRHWKMIAGAFAPLYAGALLCAPADGAGGGTADAPYLDAVRTFADNVLAHGRDTYGPKHTPLFVDGINIDTHEPATWVLKGERWVMSNLGSQQHLFRVLVGLSNLTGDDRYAQAARQATAYAFEHLQHENGLLHWGGHRFYDAGREVFVGEGVKHEMKCHYPFYELMWEVNPAATRRFLEAFWNAHILQWDNLDMNRHGSYETQMGDLWANEYQGGPVFFVGKGLTFCNTGSDLVYAAAWLHRLAGDEGALVWARRMAHRYVETRNPKTGLGGYQYSQIANDRAKAQFGPEFGERALEGTMLDTSRGTTRYGTMGLCQLRLGEAMGEAGADFLQWAHEDLTAYARWVYDETDNTIQPMLSDGTVLSAADIKRKGYYSASSFARATVPSIFLLNYALAYRLTGDEVMWDTARSMARGHGLGDIGAKPGKPGKLDLATDSADPVILFAVLEMYRQAKRSGYLRLARRIADNILAATFHKGLFTASPDHPNASFNDITPLALLHLAAAIQGKADAVPAYNAGRAYFHCPYDGMGRTYDGSAIYSRTR